MPRPARQSWLVRCEHHAQISEQEAVRAARRARARARELGLQEVHRGLLVVERPPGWQLAG